jgi:hypothetical protein
MNPVNYATMGALALGWAALASAQMAEEAGKYPNPYRGTNTVDKSHFNLLNPTPDAYLREMNPLYESPYTVDAGHVQVETYAFQYVWDRNKAGGADIERQVWSLGPMTLKLGILNNLDAQLVLTPYTKIRYKDRMSGAVFTQSGFGDVTPRVKLNIWGNDSGSTAFAFTPFVKLPTSQDGLGNNSVEGGAVFPLSVQLPYGWWLILSPEVDYMRDLLHSGRHFEFQNTAYFSHGIGDRFSGYFDFFSWASTERDIDWVGIVDFGISFLWSKNLQIDLGTSVGVTRMADDINPYIGISFRF